MKTAEHPCPGQLPARLEHELKTIGAMIALYCRAHHPRAKHLCHDCSELLDYARLRLQHCPFRHEKPTCANCTVHCYQPAMRQKIKEVMRYVGPRMMIHHPIMALRHLLAGYRKVPSIATTTQQTPTPSTPSKKE